MYHYATPWQFCLYVARRHPWRCVHGHS